MLCIISMYPKKKGRITMKITGTLIRIIALICFLSMIFVAIGEHLLSWEDYQEDLEDLAESIEKHEDQHRRGVYDYYDEDDECITCENNEDMQKYYERRGTTLVLTLVQTITMYLIFSAILFATGEIIARMSVAKAAAPQPAVQPVFPSAAPAPFCPTCGTPRQAGNRFCAICGTSMDV